MPQAEKLLSATRNWIGRKVASGSLFAFPLSRRSTDATAVAPSAQSAVQFDGRAEIATGGTTGLMVGYVWYLLTHDAVHRWSMQLYYSWLVKARRRYMFSIIITLLETFAYPPAFGM